MIDWIIQNWEGVLTIIGALMIAPILSAGIRVIKN